MNNEQLTFPGFTDYLTCLLWSSVHFESEDDSGTPFDEIDAEFSEAALDKLLEEYRDFYSGTIEPELEAWEPDDNQPWPLSDEQIGHDFCLTRNGHGAGFWDRGLGELGDRLTAACKPYGSIDIYLSDSGEIEAM